MNSGSNKEALPPKCLNLRIHSSVLAGDSDRNEIQIPRDIAVRPLNRHCEGNATDSHDGLIFSVEDSIDASHVYVSANTDDNVDQSRFDFVASSTRERILVQPSVDGIDVLGRRARARLEEQRQNRKGIKVIEDTQLIKEQIQKEPKPKATSAIGGKKRQRPKHRSPTKQSSSTKIARRLDKLRWTPEISEIQIPTKHLQSSYVQLHGLPIGSTSETVRRFFTGLTPERILVVLSNRTHISELDASSYDDLSSFNLQDIIYTNRDVRVLVKFESTTAAGFAADRSGETISLKSISVRKSHEGVVDYQQDNFSIGVSKISKEMALSLSKLSFDALPGVPFHDCLSGVESKLQTEVREILWASANRACGVALDREIKKANFLIKVSSREGDSADELNLFTFSEYKRHSIYYNRLLRIQEGLMTSVQSQKSDVEATFSTNPILRLTSHACTVLDRELDRIDSLLYQYRASRFIDINKI